MWAIEICWIDPLPLNSCPKNSSRLMPMTISGVTIGSSSSVSLDPRVRRPSRVSPRPSSVPSTVATITATSATWSVTMRAPMSSSFWNSRGYQRSVGATHAKLCLDALNENRIRIRIGRNRKM